MKIDCEFRIVEGKVFLDLQGERWILNEIERQIRKYGNLAIMGSAITAGASVYTLNLGITEIKKQK